MIDADDYTRQVEDEVRAAVTDALYSAAVEQVTGAFLNLLAAAGCEEVQEHVNDAEVVEALLASLPWDDVADTRARRHGLVSLVNASDGRIVHHHIAV